MLPDGGPGAPLRGFAVPFIGVFAPIAGGLPAGPDPIDTGTAAGGFIWSAGPGYRGFYVQSLSGFIEEIRSIFDDPPARAGDRT